MSRLRPYLPSDKQFLVTRRVRCQRRVKSLQDDAASGADVAISNEGSELGGSDGWIEPGGSRQEGRVAPLRSDVIALEAAAVGPATAAAPDSSDGDEYADIGAALSAMAAEQPPLPSATGGGASSAAPRAAPAPAGDAAAAAAAEDDEYADLSAFVDASLIVHDAGAAAAPVPPAGVPPPAPVSASVAGGGLRASAARAYDVSITYDNYYRTPRVFLCGYDEVGLPLTPEQMMEDVQQDYANRTAVLESHPHLEGGAPHISIHPCRHAATMKRILDSMTSASEGGAAVPPPTVDSYLFTFLKFISSVIPTIECDFTISVETGRRTVA